MPRLGHKASFPRINSTLEVEPCGEQESGPVCLPDQCAYKGVFWPALAAPSGVSGGAFASTRWASGRAH